MENMITSRYIHTGNSGLTISVCAHDKNKDRGTLVIESSSMGAFHNRLESHGNSYDGFTPEQLRDLARVFLDSAYALETGQIMYLETSPDIVSTKKVPRVTKQAEKSLSPGV